MARLSRDALVFKALCVLDGAIRDCEGAPLKSPLPGLRLALSYLYSVSSDSLGIQSTDREVFDAFRLTVTGEDERLDFQARCIRTTLAGTHFAGICRRVGVARTIDFGEALARASGLTNPADHRRQFAQAVRDAAGDAADLRTRRIEATRCYLDRPGKKG